MAAVVPILPGQELRLRIVRPGDQPGQGIGFLTDDTMVVFERGLRALGKQIAVTVASVLETSAGRMVFARPMLP
jgi:uncharacterized protein YacL